MAWSHRTRHLLSGLMWIWAGALVACACCACCPYARAQNRTLSAAQAPGAASTPDRPLPSAAAAHVRGAAGMGPRACYGALRRVGVDHRALEGRDTRAVAMPVELEGPVGGVEFRAAGGRTTHEVVDCRLALALSAWGRRLQRLGITKVEHFSAFRPGARVAGSGRRSGHARAMALDAARFHLADGRVLDVERDWAQRERGGPVCPVRRGEPETSEILRSAVCEAVEMGAFQVILTPHHDRAHENHIHMELVPDVDWTYIH